MKPLVLRFFSILVFLLPYSAALGGPAAHAQAGPTAQNPHTFVPRPRLVGQRRADEKVELPGNGNLPESASALPLLSAIGAGALLAGLLSARRTRR